MAKLTFFDGGRNLDVTLLGGAINLSLGGQHFQMNHDDTVLLANILAIQMLKQKVVSDSHNINCSDLIEALKRNK